MINNKKELITLCGPFILASHNSNSNNLDFDLPYDINTSSFKHELLGFELSGKAVRFTSISARNDMLAEYVY